MVTVQCPTCGERLELDDRHLGREVECGACRAEFIARAETTTRPARPRYDDPDEDFDDSEDDRPRRPRTRRERDADDLADGAARVKPAAVALVAVSVLGLLYRIADTAFIAVNGPPALPPPFGPPPGGPAPPGFFIGMYLGIGAVLTLTVVALAGATQMLRLRSYTLAVTAAVVSIVPCTGCCLLSMPVGIWALVVLLNPQVKRAFELTRDGVTRS